MLFYDFSTQVNLKLMSTKWYGMDRRPAAIMYSERKEEEQEARRNRMAYFSAQYIPELIFA